MAQCKAKIRVKEFVVTIEDVEATTEVALKERIEDMLLDGDFNEVFQDNSQIVELDEVELDVDDDDEEPEEDEVVESE